MRNARKVIKGSKDSNSSRVSFKNVSEILWPSSWVLGQVAWATMAPKLLHLWRHSQKIRNPQFYFEWEIQHKTCCIFCAIEQLSTTFGAWVTRAQSHVRSGCFSVNRLI